MARDVKGRITDAGQLDWGGPLSTHRAKELLKANPGEWFTLTIDDRESAPMRRYFHAAVKPWFFYPQPRIQLYNDRRPRGATWEPSNL